MHLPDGSLDNVTCTVTTLLAAGAVGFAYRQARRESATWNASVFASTCAFVFAMQMVNFPVAQGVSGHMVGGTLAGALLGPWLGLMAMTLVLVAQCFLAADGGITTLGANILTMGVVATWGGAVLRSIIQPFAQRPAASLAASAFAAWASICAAGVACAVIWSIGSAVPRSEVLGPMLSIHARIGIGEAVITAAALAVVMAWNARKLPAIPYSAALCAFAAAMAVAMFAAPFAAASPDGLESIAAGWTVWPEGGFAFAPLADYQFPGLGNEAIATALAGAVGTLVVFMLAQAPAQARRLAGHRAEVRQ
jgi:cobalt/nickel transport system permease protein